MIKLGILILIGYLFYKSFKKIKDLENRLK